MSSTTPTTGASPPASTATTRTQGHTARPGTAQEGGGDLFSGLLALLSATPDAPSTLAASDGEDHRNPSSQGPAQAGDAPDHNPLAALLGWTGATPQAQTVRPGGPTAAAAEPPPGLALAPGAGANGMASGLTQARGDATGPALPGMTLLQTPVAADASTLAALDRVGMGEARPGPRALGSEAARALAGRGTVSDTSAARPAAWRSTVATPASTTAQALQSSPPAGNDRVLGAHPALLAQTRSTVALDARFEQSETSDPPLAVAAGIASTGHAAGAGAQPQGGGAGSPGAAPDTNTPDSATERSEASAADTATPDAPREAEATHDAAHWGTPNLRHASLRVGEAGEDAIDIQLAMSGQELSVEFRTDSAEARASLAQDANKALGDLLQRSGIQLGSVSVGAQSQQQGEPGRAPAPTPSLGRARPGGENEASAAPAATLRPRLDGSRPLDLFV